MSDDEKRNDTPLEGMDPEKLLRVGLDAFASSPFDRETLAAAFPSLTILSVLGRGGMGVVYKARQNSLDRDVALKILPPEVAEAPGFAERFEREAKALAQFSHENIVGIHEAGRSEGLYFIMMEYVDGVNLRQAQANGVLAPEQALQIVPQICDALSYAHERGIVHRDIKPENILLDRRGRVKIADFGLAKLVRPTAEDFSLTGASQVMGTVHYIAPEQLRTPKEVDHRADIYSLGVVFYEMLTGDLPLGRFPLPSEKVAIDVRLDEVVLRSLERERERRYQRADDLKTGVASAVSGEAPAPVAPVSPPLPDTEKRLSGMAVAGSLGVPVAIIVALLVDAIPGVRDETANLVGGMIALIGVVLCMVAYHNIKANPHRLTGLRLAKWGAALPPLVLGVGFLLMMALYLGFQAPQQKETLSQAQAAQAAEQERRYLEDSVDLILDRLTETGGGMADLDAIAEMSDPSYRTWFANLKDGEWSTALEGGELGLGLYDVNTLPAPLSKFKVDRMIIQGATAEVAIRHGTTRLSFTMIRHDGTWYLGIGPNGAVVRDN